MWKYCFFSLYFLADADERQRRRKRERNRLFPFCDGGWRKKAEQNIHIYPLRTNTNSETVSNFKSFQSKVSPSYATAIIWHAFRPQASTNITPSRVYVRVCVCVCRSIEKVDVCRTDFDSSVTIFWCLVWLFWFVFRLVWLNMRAWSEMKSERNEGKKIAKRKKSLLNISFQHYCGGRGGGLGGVVFLFFSVFSTVCSVLLALLDHVCAWQQIPVHGPNTRSVSVSVRAWIIYWVILRLYQRDFGIFIFFASFRRVYGSETVKWVSSFLFWLSVVVDVVRIVCLCLASWARMCVCERNKFVSMRRGMNE